MERLFASVKNSIVYMDDMLVYARSLEELRNMVKEVKKVMQLNDLTINEKKSLYDQEKGWEEEQQSAFDELKLAAENDLVKRGYFDDNDKTILYMDASPWGLGAVLAQENMDGSERRIIACASKSLTAVESRYPQLHREALAII
uniref:Reverse transcriptase domain-containing protein n=1 Tax=Anopheles stephensi TaxID=30069 RepID=A0A182YS02_ANOST